MNEKNKIVIGDCLEELKKLPNNSVDCCVTSPPYFNLRSYMEDSEHEIGKEETLPEYISKLVEVFEEVRRVLKDSGTFWLNIGDSYAGSGKGRNPDGSSHSSALAAKQGTNGSVVGNIKGGNIPAGIKRKELMNVPHRLVIALSDAGWYHRQTIIWAKATSGEIREGSCMPESVNDRLNQSFEYIFLLTKKDKYYFDSYAIKEPVSQNSIQLSKSGWKPNHKAGVGHAIQPEVFENMERFVPSDGLANMRSVWRINLQPGSNGNHIAGFPEKIPYYCIKAGSSEKGCCNDCGKPYERILESNKINRNELDPDNPNYRPNNYNGKYTEINGKGDGGYNNTVHLGWQKTCNCESNELTPSLILDPFMGSGTVAVVALKEQRDFYGIELNPESQQFAMERIKPHFYKSKNLF